MPLQAEGLAPFFSALASALSPASSDRVSLKKTGRVKAKIREGLSVLVSGVNLGPGSHILSVYEKGFPAVLSIRTPCRR